MWERINNKHYTTSNILEYTNAVHFAQQVRFVRSLDFINRLGVNIEYHV